MKRIVCLVVTAILVAFVFLAPNNSIKSIEEQKLATFFNDVDIDGDFSVEDDWEFEVKCGDLTKNGIINALDLTELKKQLTGESQKVIVIEIKDTNGDQVFDILDLVRLKRYLADKTVNLG